MNPEDLISEEDLNQEGPPDAIADMKLLGDELGKLYAELAEHEETLKALKADITDIESNELPAAMQAVGLTSFTTDDGHTINIADEATAKISAPNMAKACAWLRKHNYAGIIKTKIALEFGAGDDELSNKALAYIESNEELPAPALSNTIHASTLKSFVKEQLFGDLPADAPAIPHDIFGIYIYSKATIEKGKKK